MIENTKLTALVASRICHDMVEPMSAIIQGLEMIKDGDGTIPHHQNTICCGDFVQLELDEAINRVPASTGNRAIANNSYNI